MATLRRADEGSVIGSSPGLWRHSVLVRLYLSSFRLGDHPQRLLELAGHGRRLALVANALDGSLEQVRRAGVDREVTELASLGFFVTEIDLRDGLAAAKRLPEADVIWVRGGNVFVLRRRPRTPRRYRLRMSAEAGRGGAGIGRIGGPYWRLWMGRDRRLDGLVRCPVTLSGFGAVPDPSDHHQGGPAGALELAEVVAQGVQSPFTVGLVGAS